MSFYGCQIGLFEDDELLKVYQYEGEKKEVIKFINKKTNDLIVENYFLPEREIKYKIYTSKTPEKWSTIDELVEGGNVKLAKD